MSEPEGEEVEACPNCDSTNINERESKDIRWSCWDCGERFDTPVTRPRKPSGPRSGSAGALLGMDADEVFGA